MPITLCCLLWATPGNRSALHVYEDTVLSLLGDHSATLVQRAANENDDETPDEVQLFEFSSQSALDGYLADPRRTALAEERERVVARTELFPVTFRNALKRSELT